MTVIKRYSNRKLYDTETSRYLTLDDIGEMVREGQEVQVVDHATGADLTALTLSQIIFETEKKIGGMLPRTLLAKLIRSGGNTWDEIRYNLAALLDSTEFVDAEIERRLARRVEEGRLPQAEAEHITELVITRHRSPEEIAEDKESLALRQEFERLCQRVTTIEGQIDRLPFSDHLFRK